MKKNDIKLVIIFFIIVIGIFCVNRFLVQKDGAYAMISVDGVQYGRYSLEKDQMIAIGDTNKAQIRDHSVFMVEANCPDKLCVQQKAIGKHRETIVCLPNKVVIEVQGNLEKTEVDVIVN